VFSAEDVEDLHRRWAALQAGFVDDSGAATTQPESLVEEVVRA